MMREIADNILDIAQNSVAAGAKLLKLTVSVDYVNDKIALKFDDDGKGMDEEFLKTVADPFTTTRTTRKVGLGLPMLNQTAAMTGGDFSITSTEGVGTVVTASFGLSNIDRPPMGDITGTFFALVIMNTHMDFEIVYEVVNDDERKAFEFNTAQIKQMVEPLEIDSPDISSWIRDYIKQEIFSLHGGAGFQ